MPEFEVNGDRFDPYKNFKFRVKWDGRAVAGVSKVGALKRTTEVVKHREGGDPSSTRKSPGRTEYEAITLERGVTHDPEFEKWANKVWNFGAGLGAETSLKDFRKGAFQGTKPSDAYFVKVDAETTTQNDRNLGIVNIWVGFAPLKPAEFVVIRMQQMAGQSRA